MKELKDLMKKKMAEGQFLDEKKKGMLSDLVKEMRAMAHEKMGKNLQKVTVMAKDKKSMEKGLDKAKDLVEEMPEMDLEKKDSMDADAELKDIAKEEYFNQTQEPADDMECEEDDKEEEDMEKADDMEQDSKMEEEEDMAEETKMEDLDSKIEELKKKLADLEKMKK